MTAKIPVGATIADTYRFAFRNFLTNLGAIWIPLVLFLAAGYLFRPYFAKLAHITPVHLAAGAKTVDPAALQAMQNNAAIMAAAAPYFVLLGIFVFVFLASIYAALTREALQLRQGNVMLANPFGKPTWRLLGAFLLLMLIGIGLYIAIIIVSVVGALVAGHIFGSLGPNAKAATALVVGLVLLIAFAGWIYVCVRLAFLVTPVVVAEGKISIARGWRLTRGNFWRIVAILFAVIVPLFVVYFGMLLLLFGRSLVPPFGGTPQDMAAWSQTFATHSLAVQQQLWFLYYPLTFAISVVVYGLLCGLPAFAYRALVAGESQSANR